jgi:hypothetical protein
LKVQTPDHAKARPGQIILNEGSRNTMLRVTLSMEGFKKKTALIRQQLWLNN